MFGVSRELGACGVRSGTEHPCPHPAVVRLWGVPFCERCASEQEAYFAIGDLTQELTEDLEEWFPQVSRDESLVEALRRLRRRSLGEHVIEGAGERLEVVRRGA